MSDTKLREKADALIAFTQLGPRFIAWVEAVTDALAPEPEKVAKVCGNCGEKVSSLSDHVTCAETGDYYCQPAPPEPAESVDTAKTVAYNNELDERYGDGTLARAMELSGLSIPTTPLAVEREEERQAAGEWWRNLAQPVAVGMTEALRMILDVAESRAEDQRHDGLLECSRNLERAIAAVRQQAAQGRKVEFPKGRELVSIVRSLTPYLSQLGCTDLARSFNDYADASATELDAAEGKGERRG